MPTYTYYCKKCDEPFEVSTSLENYDPGLLCTCGTVARRVYSSIGTIFKGSGWYSKDSRKPRRSSD